MCMPFLDDFNVRTVLQPAVEKTTLAAIAPAPETSLIAKLPAFLKMDSDGNGKPDFKGLATLAGGFVLASVALGFVFRGKKGAAAAMRAPAGWYKTTRTYAKRGYAKARGYAKRRRQPRRRY